MKAFALSVLLVGTIAATSAFAMPPAGAPAGTTGLCKDGSYWSNAEKKGACHGHKGVKDWYVGDASPGSTTTTTTPPPATTTTTKSSTTSVGGNMAPANMGAPAPGGGAGKVWANTRTKVYHCSGAKYYGTTKHGEYLSEAEATTKGYHADHGKACG